MELKIRYDNEYQTVELDAEATEELWISLSLEGDGLSQEEREEMIRDEWEVRFNRPEYNSWHKFGRHIDWFPKCRRMDGKTGYIGRDSDDPTFHIMDYLLTTSDEEPRDDAFRYEEICGWV